MLGVGVGGGGSFTISTKGLGVHAGRVSEFPIFCPKPRPRQH